MKRVFLLTLALILFAPLFTHASVVNRSNTNRVTNGLVGYWTFDGGDMSPNVVDRSGQGNNGSMIGFVSTSSAQVAGAVGQAIYFTGKSNNQFVTAGNPSSLQITGAMTISGWFRGQSNASTECGIGKLAAAPQRGYQLGIRNDGSVYGYIASDASTLVTVNTNTGVNNPNIWTHWVLVYVPSTSLTLYKNTVQAAQNTTSIPSSQYSASNEFYMGRRPDALCNFLGSLDDVRIYNRVLSASEINALYEMGSPSKINRSPVSRLTSGLVGLWTFDGQDMGTNVVDRSGRGNNGFMVNFTSTSTAQALGKIGQALTFDGVNDYINISPASSINNLGPVTYAMWINPTSVGTGSFGGAEMLDKRYRVFHISNSRAPTIPIVTRMFISTNNTNAQPFCNDIGIPTNTWTHVAVTWDGQIPFTGTFYVNGVACTTSVGQTGVGSTVDDSGQNLFIGRRFDDTGLFPGKMDDIRIYNRVLSASEIVSLYNLGAPSIANKSRNARVTSGLVGLWTFDGPDMLTNVADKSGNGNNGFMNGFTSTSTAQVLGKIGQGLNFDGVDDAISTNSDLIGTGDVTVTAWIKPRSVGENSLGAIVTNGNFFFSTRSTNNIEVRNANNTLSSASNGSITLNKWQFVATTRSGTNVQIYIDGVASCTISCSSNDTPVAGTTNVFIGNRSIKDRTFDGDIDDVRIYNRVLSASEITSIYNLGR